MQTKQKAAGQIGILAEQIKHLAGVLSDKHQGEDVETEVCLNVIKEKAESIESLSDSLS